MIQFRCWFCNKRYAVTDQRAGERLTCTCKRLLRVPRQDGGNSRARTWTDWIVEALVYGGGGITPDEKFELAKYNAFQIEVLRKYALFNFSAKYFGARDAKLPKGWEPDETVVNDFHQFLVKNGVEFTEAQFIENRDWIKQQLKPAEGLPTNAASKKPAARSST